MDSPLNIQNTFFNQCRKDRSKVTVYLTSGIKLVGRIKSFDKFTLILESGSGDQMIFKHAISTVAATRQFGNYIQMDRNKPAEARGKPKESEATATGSASGASDTQAPGAGAK